jgi:pimeloyl-ACP methyl ester carboxylesterase
MLLVFLAFLSCREDIKKPRSGTLFRDGASIDYHIYGDGGATLVFVHGAFTDQTYWKAQVDYFKDDYKVVTFDLPGHGKSGKGRKYWSVEGFAGDVYSVVRRLNLKNVILIGHSLGGDIDLIEATSHPKNVIGFIGIDNFKHAATPLPPQIRQQAETIKRQLKRDFAKTSETYARAQLLTGQTPQPIAERVAADYRNAYPPMGRQTLREAFDMYETERRLLTKLRLKLHLINVDYTPTDEAPLKKYCSSGYDVRHMAGTCHYPMLEHPNELNRLLRETIDDIARENDGRRQ